MYACTVRKEAVRVRMKTLSVLVLSCILLSMVFYPRSLAEPPGPPAAGEPLAMTMHFKGDKLTTADPAAGNSTEEKASAAGRPYGARRTGTVIGEWAFLPKGDFQIQGSFKAELWGQSSQGAKNAGFRLNFYVGSTLVKGVFSDRADVSSPHKFMISDSVTATARAGQTVKCGLVWLSDPNYIVGPSSGGDFLYGSKDHDSKITMTLAGVPVTMNVTGYEHEKDAVKINCRVNESLGMDPNDLAYKLSVTAGPAQVQPGHIGKAFVAGGENGTIVSWIWDTKASHAQSGLYTMIITVAYSNDTMISNATQLEVKFPVEVKVTGLAAITSGTNLYIIVALVIAIIVSGSLGFTMWRRRRRRRARLRAERELAMAAEAA